MADLSKFFSDLPAELDVNDKVSEYKLVKLYAYNEYFNADPLKTDDVNNGFTFNRKNNFGIDGVYINETLEENTIECVYAIWCGSAPFSIKDTLNALDHISAFINDVRKRQFGANKKAEDLLTEYLSESETKKIIIKIITDYNPDEVEKYDIIKRVSQHDVSVTNLDVTSAIVFYEDIVASVEANVAPYDYVDEGKLVIDNPNNILKYQDNSFVCNISAQSLKALWKKEGRRGLLAMNLRYFVKSGAIDEKIENSIMFDPKTFWYLNNGIIIVCNDYAFVNNELRLKGFSIVNGGQTTNRIGEIPFDHDFHICCKVIKNTFETANDKNIFISKVAEASNTQKPIKPKDIIANRIEQRNLKTLMSDNGIFIEIKRGEKCNKETYPEPWQKTKNNELAQDLYSFVFLQPGPARNSVSSILQSQEKYDLIFKNHSFSFPFLKDLLILEKAYRDYSKEINKLKDDEVHPYKKGLVKNGLFYTLATLGYILKICYNKEYESCMQKYRNMSGLYELYSIEPAFNHSFLAKRSYNEIKPILRKLFDFVFTNIIIPQFELAKSANASIAYSNWMKSNTGFEAIRRQINVSLFDLKQQSLITVMAKYFLNISEDQLNANIDMYVDYCKANKKIKSKDTIGNELGANDEALRNALMIFRLNKSNSSHMLESKIFTDKMLDKLVIEKPLDKEALKKIVGANTCYFCGDDILAIIAKHL